MPHFICVHCGVQYAETERPPAACRVCQDERQFITGSGQQWSTIRELRWKHRNVLKAEEPGITGIGIEPPLGLGQRALFIQSDTGNILWDCIPFFDHTVAELIRAAGGLSAIAISHPHYYGSMVEWSRAFGDPPIYIHEADRQWVMRPDPAVVFWSGPTHVLAQGMTLIRCGGHFDGGSVLHWAEGADGGGALMTGDVLQVVPNRQAVSFMYSYTNLIPLPASTVRQIVAALEPFAFSRIYGAGWDRMIISGGKAAVMRSAERYIRAIGEPAATGKGQQPVAKQL